MRRPDWTAWGLGLLAMVLLPCDGRLLAGDSARRPPERRILETEIGPHSRPMTFSRLLDEYLATLQQRLKHEAMSVQEPGLVEVKLTVRDNGSVTFSEVVVLEGPAALRGELLPLVDRLDPLPPPPVDADFLHISVLLPLQYPGPDLWDSLDQEGWDR
jgi:hypothetical protein